MLHFGDGSVQAYNAPTPGVPFTVNVDLGHKTVSASIQVKGITTGVWTSGVAPLKPSTPVRWMVMVQSKVSNGSSM